MCVALVDTDKGHGMGVGARPVKGMAGPHERRCTIVWGWSKRLRLEKRQCEPNQLCKGLSCLIDCFDRLVITVVEKPRVADKEEKWRLAMRQRQWGSTTNMNGGSHSCCVSKIGNATECSARLSRS